ncbi:hypothetical protein [Bacillus sp. AFS055030]|uniref:hypothetical protein n=1 Tax=Bacillus sp. AFS055030 TaxID=2033507 RepID=UPI000BFBC2A0|nr:hypothetical protein [Bacillus sp. AFS055030]PGL66768.1 hypothetical protein CN925_20855 [Bacillus sp. AFS055030]
MNELIVFGELHKYINSLGPMKCTMAAKSLSLGYKPISFSGAFKKFATLYGDKKYHCLILHVDPGNPESTKGKAIQKEVQEILNFEIKEMRNFVLKKHEVYVPFEIIDSKEKMELLKVTIKCIYEILFKKKF